MVPDPGLALMQRSVLIVDDSAALRTALRSLITWKSDWHVCGEASNGVEAICEAIRLKPDVVVLDFWMPVMNGIEAAMELKKVIPEAHLLMFTSYAIAIVEGGARLVGIETFIEKGDTETLLQTLRELEAKGRAC